MKVNILIDLFFILFLFLLSLYAIISVLYTYNLTQNPQCFVITHIL